MKRRIASLDAEASESVGFHPVRLRAAESALSERLAPIEILLPGGATVRGPWARLPRTSSGCSRW